MKRLKINGQRAQDLKGTSRLFNGFCNTKFVDASRIVYISLISQHDTSVRRTRHTGSLPLDLGLTGVAESLVQMEDLWKIQQIPIDGMFDGLRDRYDNSIL